MENLVLYELGARIQSKEDERHLKVQLLTLAMFIARSRRRVEKPSQSYKPSSPAIHSPNLVGNVLLLGRGLGSNSPGLFLIRH